MPAAGILSQKTFFPKNGDVLDDLEDEVSWECVRAHTYRDEKTGAEIRYALLIGRHKELGDTPIPKLVEDSTSPLPFLRNIQVIHRAKGGEMVTYKINERGNYEED